MHRKLTNYQIQSAMYRYGEDKAKGTKLLSPSIGHCALCDENTRFVTDVHYVVQIFSDIAPDLGVRHIGFQNARHRQPKKTMNSTVLAYRIVDSLLSLSDSLSPNF